MRRQFATPERDFAVNLPDGQWRDAFVGIHNEFAGEIDAIAARSFINHEMEAHNDRVA